MHFAWKALVGLGVLLVLSALGMDTTVDTGYERVHNIGLLGQQQTRLILGCVLFLAGIVLFAKQTPEERAAEVKRAADVRRAVESWVSAVVGRAGLALNKVPGKSATHGVGPYEIGSRVLETHKTYPASPTRRQFSLKEFCRDQWLRVSLPIACLWLLVTDINQSVLPKVVFIATLGALVLGPRLGGRVVARLLYCNAALAAAYFGWVMSLNESNFIDDGFLIVFAVLQFLLPSGVACAAFFVSQRDPLGR